MNLVYKIFGVPKTFEEFLDKIKRDNQRQIDIRLMQKSYEKSIRNKIFIFYEHNIILNADKTDFYLTNCIDCHLKNSFDERSIFAKKRENERYSMNETLRIAGNLQKLELEVTINQQPVTILKIF